MKEGDNGSVREQKTDQTEQTKCKIKSVDISANIFGSNGSIHYHTSTPAMNHVPLNNSEEEIHGTPVYAQTTTTTEVRRGFFITSRVIKRILLFIIVVLLVVVLALNIVLTRELSQTAARLNEVSAQNLNNTLKVIDCIRHPNNCNV